MAYDKSDDSNDVPPLPPLEHILRQAELAGASSTGLPYCGGLGVLGRVVGLERPGPGALGRGALGPADGCGGTPDLAL